MGAGAMKEAEPGEETIRDRAQGTVLVLAQEMDQAAATGRDLETDQEAGTGEMKRTRIHVCIQRGLNGHHAARTVSPADLEVFL